MPHRGVEPSNRLVVIVERTRITSRAKPSSRLTSTGARDGVTKTRGAFEAGPTSRTPMPIH
jgi:hypothetical protein